MSKQVVEWEYNRRPGTELYDGHLSVLTPSAREKRGKVYEEFFGVRMEWMLESLHGFLQTWPETMVHVTRRQKASDFHKERTATTTLPSELVDLLREHPVKAYEHFKPIVVRSEEDDASQG